MKLWLDDIRDPSQYGCIGWVWCKTAEAAISLLKSGVVTQASLDHDLAWEHYPWNEIPESQYHQKTGYDVVCWLEEHPQYWPMDGVKVHSQNPVGRQRMLTVIKRHYEPQDQDVVSRLGGGPKGGHMTDH